jgi:hypothetical protein
VLGGAPREPAVVTVDRYGNTASTTHLVALVEELRAGRPSVGDRVALLALASGIELGVVLFVVDEALAGPLRSLGPDGTPNRAGSPASAGPTTDGATSEPPLATTTERRGNHGNED